MGIKSCPRTRGADIAGSRPCELFDCPRCAVEQRPGDLNADLVQEDVKRAVEDHDAAGGAFFAAMEAAPPARSRADRLDESFGVGDHVVDRVPPGWYVGGWDTPVVEGDRLIARGGQGRVWCRVQTRPAAEEPMMRNTRSPRDADFPDWAGRDLATLGYTAQMLARDGAASIDVLNRQLPLIQRPPALVTITMGATICWPHAERLVQAVTLRSPR